ncbi:pickpocket protein 28-like [Ostrinia nubilalis]|uniref:pickpocket protein 28-like n=1 Tax=Ostrinia nubilalis TaxID=29057 RepID=UPI0030822395
MRIFWLVTFIVSVALSFYLISKVWNKWNTSPVIVSFADRHVFVDKVPFPAITICPAVKFKNFNYTAKLIDVEHRKVIDNDTMATASIVNLFCDRPNVALAQRLPDDWMDILLNVSMDVDDIFFHCKLGGHDCTNLVKRVLTADGICFNINGLAANNILNYDNIQKEYKYSFNEHEASNWTLTEGYTNDDVNAYPHRGQIYLHHPADWPQARPYYFAALPEQVSSMAVEFSAVSTSEDLKAVALNVRQCYFPEERPLKYFKIYSYNHCKQECLTNFTYSWYAFLIGGSKHLQKCKCLPACNYIQYDAEIHKTDYNLDDFQFILRNKRKSLIQKSTSVHIFFKEPMFMAIHRSELFGITDFLGICGGLLGLFLGFSFLSIVEIFYFLTFRVYKTITRDLKTEISENLPGIRDVEKLHDEITEPPLNLK